MSDLVLDRAQSRVCVRTFAEGMLARLAHDLELRCEGLSGTAARADEGGAIAGRATITAPVSGIDVAGVVDKAGRVDERRLSSFERRECLAKMRDDVFHTRDGGVVRVEVELANGSARARVSPPNGKDVSVTIRPAVRAEGDAVRASGSLELSLAALGSAPVKAPMGAFRVKDRVEVRFDVVFAPRPST